MIWAVLNSIREQDSLKSERVSKYRTRLWAAFGGSAFQKQRRDGHRHPTTALLAGLSVGRRWRWQARRPVGHIHVFAYSLESCDVRARVCLIRIAIREEDSLIFSSRFEYTN